MGTNHFVISDLHFGHKNLLDPEVISHGRSQDFHTVEEMDEAIIANWNRVVRPKDKVYVLGDICMNPAKQLALYMPRLAGSKTLIMGNHDMGEAKLYAKYFKYLRGMRDFDDCVLSHSPLEFVSASRRYTFNVHGHTHRRMVQPNWFYWNVCVENTGYTPLAWEDLKKLMHTVAEKERMV